MANHGLNEGEVRRLMALVEEAATFFEGSETERVAESVAISNLLSVANHPNLDEIYEAGVRLERPYASHFFGPDFSPVSTALGYVVVYLFAPTVRDEWSALPNRMGLFDGRLRLPYGAGVGSRVRTGPRTPTFIEMWDQWKDNPRRDLTPYLHEILSPEDRRRKLRQNGAVRSSSAVFPIDPNDKEREMRVAALLRRAAEAFIVPSERPQTMRLLIEAADEEDIVSVNMAGTRLLFLYPDHQAAIDTLTLFLPLLFGARRFGRHDDYPLDPLTIEGGRLTIPAFFTHGEPFDHWEGTVYFLAKLYERRELGRLLPALGSAA